MRKVLVYLRLDTANQTAFVPKTHADAGLLLMLRAAELTRERLWAWWWVRLDSKGNMRPRRRQSGLQSRIRWVDGCGEDVLDEHPTDGKLPSATGRRVGAVESAEARFVLLRTAWVKKHTSWKVESSSESARDPNVETSEDPHT